MQEWWTYTLSDFLLFSPRAYYRLLERHNTQLWPAHLLTLGLGLALLALVGRPAPWQGRIVAGAMAALWAWVGWAFIWRRYVTINWTAAYLVPLFALEALLLAWIGVLRVRLSFDARRGGASGPIGIALVVLGLVLYPGLAPLLGRGWRHAEVFGMSPDPTAISTLGLLLLAEGRARWTLMAVPVLWCMLAGATLWAMRSPEAWVPLVAALLGVAASGLKKP
ncbi:MAG TPA: DUF6064 family protein [Gemmatimonadales bacterium]|nr:DUF6064 family protein [Gemmatimonadales bacterium]